MAVDGNRVGSSVGWVVGVNVGAALGDSVGRVVGANDGVVVGSMSVVSSASGMEPLMAKMTD